MRTVAILIIMMSMAGSVKGADMDPQKPFKVILESSEHALGLKFFIQAERTDPVRVRIRNRDREIVYEHSFNGAKTYKGTLNLENLSDGLYYFEVRQKKNHFFKEINLTEYSSRAVVFD